MTEVSHTNVFNISGTDTLTLSHQRVLSLHLAGIVFHLLPKRSMHHTIPMEITLLGVRHEIHSLHHLTR